MHCMPFVMALVLPWWFQSICIWGGLPSLSLCFHVCFFLIVLFPCTSEITLCQNMFFSISKRNLGRANLNHPRCNVKVVIWVIASSLYLGLSPPKANHFMIPFMLYVALKCKNQETVLWITNNRIWLWPYRCIEQRLLSAEFTFKIPYHQYVRR